MKTPSKHVRWALYAISALLLLGYGYGSHYTKPSGGYYKAECVKDGEIVAKDDIQISTIISGDYGEALADSKKASEQNRQKNLEVKRQCSDLEAQWAMADVTWFAFTAGILGIALVFITLLLNARASRLETKARRAWVWLDTINALQTQNPLGNTTSIAFNPVVKNSGETPGTNLTAICNIAVKPTIADAINEIDASKKDKEHPNPMVIAPKTADTLTGSKISRVQIRDIISGNQVCVFWIRIKYNDLFDTGIERTSESYRELKLRRETDEDGIYIGVKSSHNAVIGYPDKIT